MMWKKRILLMLILCAMLAGCQRGDVKISTVIAGQRAPHDGYNIGPDLYLEAGDIVLVTGAVVSINGLDPNDLYKIEE